MGDTTWPSAACPGWSLRRNRSPLLWDAFPTSHYHDLPGLCQRRPVGNIAPSLSFLKVPECSGTQNKGSSGRLRTFPETPPQAEAAQWRAHRSAPWWLHYLPRAPGLWGLMWWLKSFMRPLILWWVLSNKKVYFIVVPKSYSEPGDTFQERIGMN